MPNQVTNIVEFEASAKRCYRIMKELQGHGEFLGYVDFNTLCPMPKSLIMKAGSETDRGISIYLTYINPETKDYGVRKMGINRFYELINGLNEERLCYKFKPALSESKITEFQSLDNYDILLGLGKQAVNNYLKYGASTWYEWCIQNWGSKWNAYKCVERFKGDKRLCFQTAWSSVPKLILKMSEKYPDVTIKYSWADEDVGSNCGKLLFKNGMLLEHDLPENGSKRALELSIEVLDLDESDIYALHELESEEPTQNETNKQENAEIER